MDEKDRTDKPQAVLLNALEGLQAARELKKPSPSTPESNQTKPAADDSAVSPGLVHPLAQMPSPGVIGDATPDHQRMVSWGAASEPAVVNDANISPITPGQRSWDKIDIKALQKHTPYEMEAETYLQKALDESDPTEGGESEAQRTILGHVPPDADSSTFEAPKSDQEKKTGLPLFQKGDHKKAKSTVESLWEVTNGLQELHSDGHRHSSIFSSRGSKREDEDEPTSDMDALVRNAATLMKRHKSSPTSESNEPASPTEQEPASASDRWKKLRVSVQATAAATSTKKTDEEEEVETPREDTDGSSDEEEGPFNGVWKKKKKSSKVKSGVKDFEDWLRFKRMNVWKYTKFVLFLIIVPATIVSALLYYVFDNPPCRGKVVCFPRRREGNSSSVADFLGAGDASASWWILFIFVRQVITFTLAKITEVIIIDYLSLRTRVSTKLLGPFMTLFVVQSKGWPFLILMWGAYDLGMLYGSGQFALHWLFWQDKIELFNRYNPAGSVITSTTYRNILILAIVLGFVVVIKRFWVGLYLGRQTFLRYGEELAKVMKKSLLVGRVATLARDLELSGLNLNDVGLHVDNYDANDETASNKSLNTNKSLRGGILNGIDMSSRRARIAELLGEFEEPEDLRKKNKSVSIGAIIQFRQSLSYLNSSTPFSVSFGPAMTRQECIESAEHVYRRLLLSTPERKVLRFDTIALLALRRSGELDEDMLKELIRLFRPDRDGNLTLLDFVKSIDSSYKELRLLRASVSSSSKLNIAFEQIINIVFYFAIGAIVLAALGIDPVVLFGSISAFVLGFAFMIGAACSKVFEGILFILVRRPYDIGDRINVSSPTEDTSISGSIGWVVKDIDLYTTTVIFSPTNEVATYSNGSLASFRIINAARSPKGQVIFFLKFPIDAPFDRLMTFKECLNRFCKDRPRAWASFLAFRASDIRAELGYVEYIIVAQHRESWQNVGAILDSKAELASFALELSKKMDLRYLQPPMPVDLTMKESKSQPQELNPSMDLAGHTSRDHTPSTTKLGTMNAVDYNEVAGMFENRG